MVFVRNRLIGKTDFLRLSLDFRRDFNLSNVEAQALASRFFEENEKMNPSSLREGQIWYSALDKNEPPGKPIKDCAKLRVKLSLFPPSDLEDSFSPREIRKKLVLRLTTEAVEQGAVLSVEDLARLLITSTRTVRRMIKEYREEGIFVLTRGNVCDIGPGTSHKVQAIRLYLQGYLPQKIALILSHCLESIERYIDNFCIVMMGIEEGYSPERIARNTRLSRRLVKQYAEIYHGARDNPDYEMVFERLRDRLSYLLRLRGKKEPEVEHE